MYDEKNYGNLLPCLIFSVFFGKQPGKEKGRIRAFSLLRIVQCVLFCGFDLSSLKDLPCVMFYISIYLVLQMPYKLYYRSAPEMRMTCLYWLAKLCMQNFYVKACYIPGLLDKQSLKTALVPRIRKVTRHLKGM